MGSGLRGLTVPKSSRGPIRVMLLWEEGGLFTGPYPLAPLCPCLLVGPSLHRVAHVWAQLWPWPSPTVLWSRLCSAGCCRHEWFVSLCEHNFLMPPMRCRERDLRPCSFTSLSEQSLHVVSPLSPQLLWQRNQPPELHQGPGSSPPWVLRVLPSLPRVSHVTTSVFRPWVFRERQSQE